MPRLWRGELTGAARRGQPQCFFCLTHVVDDLSIRRYNIRMYLPMFNPRGADLILGLVIGLSLALTYHVVAWTIR